MCKRGAPPAAGWVEHGTGKDGGVIYRLAGGRDDQAREPQQRRDKRKPVATKLTAAECTAIIERARQADDPGWRPRVAMLAGQLRVAAAVLELLEVGWRWGDVDAGDRAEAGDWIYPMRDGGGQVVGVHRRLAEPILRRRKDGATDRISKMMVPGTRLGLVYSPTAWQTGTGPILLPEGMSDTATLMHLGLAAAGRPNDRACVDDIARLLAAVPADRPIVVLGENDQKSNGTCPGQAGAIWVAGELAQRLQRPVLWSMPPAGAKDVRDWWAGQPADRDAAAAGAELVDELLATAQAIDPPEPDPVLDSTLGDLPEVALDDQRQQLRDRLLRLLDAPLYHMGKPTADHPAGQPQVMPGWYLATNGTGVGKSTRALELAIEAERKGLPAIVLSQTHKQSAERLAEARAMGLVDGAADPDLTEDTCGNLARAIAARDAGLSVAATVCQGCPLRDECRYRQELQQSRDAAVRFSTHAKAGLDLGQLTAGRQLVVIDEDAIPAVVRHLEVRPRDLLRALGSVRAAARRSPQQVDDDTQLLLDTLAGAVREILRGVRLTTEAGCRRVDVDHLVLPERDDASDPRWQLRLWRLLQLGTRRRQPPKDALRLLLDLATGRMTECWVTRDQLPNGGWDRRVIGIQRQRLPHKLVVLLDATATRQQVQQVLEAAGPLPRRWPLSQGVQLLTDPARTPEVYEARRLVPAGGDVLVGSSDEHAASMLRGALRRISGRVGVIMHGGHIDAVCGSDETGPGLLDQADLDRIGQLTWHHGAIVRGSNSWLAEGLDAVLTIGSPNVPGSAVRLRLLLTGEYDAAAMPDGGWQRHQVIGTTPAGDQVSNPCNAHSDPRWQAAREQLVHAALRHAVGRGRHTIDQGCRVYAVTREPLPGLLTDPTPVQPVGTAVDLAVRAVERLLEQAQTAPNPGPDSSFGDPAGPIAGRVRMLKEYSSKGSDPWPSTTAVHAELAAAGMLRTSAQRALRQAVALGLLEQPARGCWALAGSSTPQEAPTAAVAADEPAAAVATPAVHIDAVAATSGPATIVRATGPAAVAVDIVAAGPAPRSEVLEVLPDHTPDTPAADDAPLWAWLDAADDDQRELWQERAAILEHDGGMPREQADVVAIAQLIAMHVIAANGTAQPACATDDPQLGVAAAAAPPSGRWGDLPADTGDLVAATVAADARSGPIPAPVPQISDWPLVDRAVALFGGDWRVLTPAEHADPQLFGTRPRCQHEHHRDMPIGGRWVPDPMRPGQLHMPDRTGLRRECARCGAFLGWSMWRGVRVGPARSRAMRAPDPLGVRGPAGSIPGATAAWRSHSPRGPTSASTRHTRLPTGPAPHT